MLINKKFVIFQLNQKAKEINMSEHGRKMRSMGKNVNFCTKSKKMKFTINDT